MCFYHINKFYKTTLKSFGILLIFVILLPMRLERVMGHSTSNQQRKEAFLTRSPQNYMLFFTEIVLAYGNKYFGHTLLLYGHCNFESRHPNLKKKKTYFLGHKLSWKRWYNIYPDWDIAPHFVLISELIKFPYE